MDDTIITVGTDGEDQGMIYVAFPAQKRKSVYKTVSHPDAPVCMVDVAEDGTVLGVEILAPGPVKVT